MKQSNKQFLFLSLVPQLSKDVGYCATYQMKNSGAAIQFHVVAALGF